MKRFWLIGVLVFGVLGLSCMDREPGPVCPVPTEVREDELMVGGFDGVDMLIVVDNSGSMAEEQQILATAFFPFINSLANPLPGWPYPAANNVRVGIVDNDMGLQWGAPAQPPPDGVSVNGCGDWGDNGAFQQGAYAGGGTINIESGVIACAGTTQCPTNWTCDNLNNGVGTCTAPPDGDTDPYNDGDNQSCPAFAATWAETTPDALNPDLAFQVACLSSLGTDGCGFEQQLAAAAAGLNVNKDFIRDTALLAVLIVSDEEDCSIQDGPGLFGSADFKDSQRINISCGENPEFLFPASSYYNTFKALKGDQANAVVFGAFVGVPYDPDKPGADKVCQGPGNTITGCLDAPGMKLTIVDETTSGGQATKQYLPACTRGPSNAPVTKARPGRRYVELATQNPPNGFGNMSYVYSICNADWSPAMEDIAKLIASNLVGACYEKPLDWDPSTKTAKCDVVAEFVLGTDMKTPGCPWKGVEYTTVDKTDETTGQEKTYVYCPLPKLPADLDCASANVSKDKIGWYYCQDTTEASDDACADGQDNDKDGLVDCKDPECQDCKIACSKDFPNATGKDCALSCKFNVRVTDAGKKAVKGKSLSVQCLQQFSFTDPNCQENTKDSCQDDKDNDGNGVWDCTDVTKKTAKTPVLHMADANCCPMKKGAKNKCVVDAATFVNCPGFSKSKLPDSCDAAQQLLGCDF
jgi:hypothetical protein